MLDNEGFAAGRARGHPSLRGRILFTSSSPGDDDAAVAQAQRPDRRRGQDQGRAGRQHDRAHPRRRRHGAGPFERHDDARRGPRGRRPVREHRLRSARTRASAPTWSRIPGGTPARCNPVTAPPDVPADRRREPEVAHRGPVRCLTSQRPLHARRRDRHAAGHRALTATTEAGRARARIGSRSCHHRPT